MGLSQLQLGIINSIIKGENNEVLHCILRVSYNRQKDDFTRMLMNL